VARLRELPAGELVETLTVEAQSKAGTDRSDPREQPASGVAEFEKADDRVDRRDPAGTRCAPGSPDSAAVGHWAAVPPRRRQFNNPIFKRCYLAPPAAEPTLNITTRKWRAPSGSDIIVDEDPNLRRPWRAAHSAIRWRLMPRPRSSARYPLTTPNPVSNSIRTGIIRPPPTKGAYQIFPRL
jgi:hypothetical protein